MNLLYLYGMRQYLAHFYHYIQEKWYDYKHHYFLKEVRKKEKIRVVFFAMNLSMWRYQNLCKKMLERLDFEVYVVLSPCQTFPIEQQKRDMAVLRSFFSSTNIPYIDYDFEGLCFDVRKKLNPDILFYPQPYIGVLCKKHDCKYFFDRLIGYYPYAFWTVLGNWSYNTLFHNVAWKLYYSTDLHKQDAMMLSDNKGRNVVVVGYPTADDFLSSGTFRDVWKPQTKIKKRLIWAPHFTISKERSNVVHSNFLWMADFMLNLADKYADRLQIAFKPHPRLLTELYVHPNWGKEKADDYYKKWEMLDNGQLDEGDFKDLFMTSDAMIHDCGSFTVEYHYSLNPVMYILEEESDYTNTLSAFGRKAFEAHYIGRNSLDIIHFVEKILFDGEDKMYQVRKEFYDNFLLPPNGISVADNTLNDILASLGK